MEAAEDAVSSLDTKRIEARRDKVTAQRHLTEAQSRQRDAVTLWPRHAGGSTPPVSLGTWTSRSGCESRDAFHAECSYASV